MPIARTEIARQEKVDEILRAARSRLVAGGYDEMSVAAIARDLGLATNSIYWYFPSKDDLFVAVLREMLVELAQKKPPAGRGVVVQILWITDQMQHLAPLREQLRNRATQSAVAAAFETELDTLLRRLAIHGIEPHLQSSEVEIAATALLAIVEGALRLGLTRTERHRVIRFTLNRILHQHE